MSGAGNRFKRVQGHFKTEGESNENLYPGKYVDHRRPQFGPATLMMPYDRDYRLIDMHSEADPDNAMGADNALKNNKTLDNDAKRWRRKGVKISASDKTIKDMPTTLNVAGMEHMGPGRYDIFIPVDTVMHCQPQPQPHCRYDGLIPVDTVPESGFMLRSKVKRFQRTPQDRAPETSDMDTIQPGMYPHDWNKWGRHEFSPTAKLGHFDRSKNRHRVCATTEVITPTRPHA